MVYTDDVVQCDDVKVTYIDYAARRINIGAAGAAVPLGAKVDIQSCTAAQRDAVTGSHIDSSLARSIRELIITSRRAAMEL